MESVNGPRLDTNTATCSPSSRRSRTMTRSSPRSDDASPDLPCLPELGCNEESRLSSGKQLSVNQLQRKGTLEKLRLMANSAEAASSTGSISRDSSTEAPYTDYTGADLEQFIQVHLNKSAKDREQLLDIEKKMTEFIKDPKSKIYCFPAMTSYHRMFVHRIAAFFGLEHNVDQTGKQVIVQMTPNSRIPDFKFKEHTTIEFAESATPSGALKKQILKRDSSDESKLEAAADERPRKSVEEREQDYEKMRKKIFADESGETLIVRQRLQESGWLSADSSGYSSDRSHPLAVSKANSFAGTGMSILGRGSSITGSIPQNSDSAAASCLGSPGDAGIPSQMPTYAIPNSAVFVVFSSLEQVMAGSLLVLPYTGQAFLKNPDGTLQPVKLAPAQIGALKPPDQILGDFAQRLVMDPASSRQPPTGCHRPASPNYNPAGYSQPQYHQPYPLNMQFQPAASSSQTSNMMPDDCSPQQWADNSQMQPAQYLPPQPHPVVFMPPGAMPMYRLPYMQHSDGGSGGVPVITVQPPRIQPEVPPPVPPRQATTMKSRDTPSPIQSSPRSPSDEGKMKKQQWIQQSQQQVHTLLYALEVFDMDPNLTFPRLESILSKETGGHVSSDGSRVFVEFRSDQALQAVYSTYKNPLFSLRLLNS